MAPLPEWTCRVRHPESAPPRSSNSPGHRWPGCSSCISSSRRGVFRIAGSSPTNWRSPPRRSSATSISCATSSGCRSNTTGFIYTEPVTSFPSIEVSEGEVIALFVAQKALEQYRGTSFEKPLRTAFEKITEGLKDRIGFQWGDVDSAISFRGLGTSVADIELFETMSQVAKRSRGRMTGMRS